MSDTRRYAYDTIQGQGHGDLKCVKMADFNGYLLCQYASVKRQGEF